MVTELDPRPVAVVVVAASAGGVEALTGFVGALPRRFAGVVLVILHIPDAGPSLLPDILARSGELPVVQAREGTPLRRSLVVVAPPGQHLRVRDGKAQLDRGPRENG
ncbi:MAG TPA: chemotaxis protein CheB, partial [Acidimicrobiales bacterium]|nr:chemotaxis protein CheB [Acidimicrobiales bacterium]